MDKHIPVGPVGQENTIAINPDLVAVSYYSLDQQTGEMSGGSALMSNGVTVPLDPDGAKRLAAEILPPPPKPEKPSHGGGQSDKHRQDEIISHAHRMGIEDLPGQKAAQQEEDARAALAQVEQGKDLQQDQKAAEHEADKAAKHNQKSKPKH